LNDDWFIMTSSQRINVITTPCDVSAIIFIAGIGRDKPLVQKYSALIFATRITQYYELFVSITGGMILNRIERSFLKMSYDQKAGASSIPSQE